MVEVVAKKGVSVESTGPGNCLCGCVWNNDFTAYFEAYLVGSCCGCACPEQMVYGLAYCISAG